MSDFCLLRSCINIICDGFRFLNKKDYNQALRCFYQAANENGGAAFYFVGLMYYRGYGVMKNFDFAFMMFTRAAESGLSYAMFDLGNLYYHGLTKNLTQNLTQSLMWFTRAAEKGDPFAAYNLGVIYKNLLDYKQSTKWYQVALNYFSYHYPNHPLIKNIQCKMEENINQQKSI